MNSELLEILDSLRSYLPSVEQGTFISEAFPGFINNKLAINEYGEVLVLINSSNKESKKFHSVRLELVEVAYDQLCLISNSARDTSEMKFTVLKLKSVDQHLQEYFIGICKLILTNLPSNPSLHEVKEEVEKVLNMFDKAAHAAKKTMQGLFGELVLIMALPNKQQAIDAWHMKSNDNFDFNFLSCLIEVKSSSINERRHTFSNTQLHNQTSKTPIYIASTILLQNSEGISVLDLVRSIEREVTNIDTKIKLNDTVLDVLGESIINANDYHYNIDYALGSLSFYNLQDLPRIELECISPSISNLKYEVDLSISKATSPNEDKLLRLLFSS